MRVLDRIERLGRFAHDWRIHVAAALVFVLVNGVGYAFGGVEFVQGWGGGLAAVIATAYLVWKSQAYWAWMMVNAALWCALFFDAGLPLLGWLQVALFGFAAYGMTQWALVRFRIGWSPSVPSDLVGAALGLVVLAYAVYAYRGLEGYTGTFWWGLEAASVLLAITAMWLDAFRYRANWYAWSLSNLCFWPVAFHGKLWGPFFTTFVYQAINVVGWFQWTRDERRLLGGRPVRGLVFGKFMPLHRGHQRLIERALADTDELTVAVYDSAPPGRYPAMPLELRTRWLRELYPQIAAVVPLEDPLRDRPVVAVQPGSAPLYAGQLRPLGPFDRVYSSEEKYGRFARELGAEHVVVEPAPISATRIRTDPYEHREWLDARVYADLVEKVVFVGTESTGKTTLARTLAERLRTKWAHEYGRELWVERNGELSFADYLTIGRTQHEREETLRPDARRYLFCDTNAWTTLHWSLRAYGCADARLWELAAATMGDYRWFLCVDDFPWQQDGWREMAGGEAHRFQLQLQADLDDRGIDYVVLEGPPERRLERVLEELGEVEVERVEQLDGRVRRVDLDVGRDVEQRL